MVLEGCCSSVDDAVHGEFQNAEETRPEQVPQGQDFEVERGTRRCQRSQVKASECST